MSNPLLQRSGRAGGVGAAVLAAGVVASLTGCLGSFDAAAPAWRVVNEGEADLVVRVEGDGRKVEILDVRVPSGDAVRTELAGECLGVRMIVETPDGEEIARAEEPACLGWTLTVSPDGSLEYEEM